LRFDNGTLAFSLIILEKRPILGHIAASPATSRTNRLDARRVAS